LEIPKSEMFLYCSSYLLSFNISVREIITFELPAEVCYYIYLSRTHTDDIRQVVVQYWVFMNTAMKIRAPYNVWNFLNS
jgi:hypothetical protein